jgi:hypothetical protein
MTSKPHSDTADLNVVEEALKRAHRSATAGSAQARSGTLGSEAQYVLAVLNRARDATRSWANWEAINEAFGPATRAGEALAWNQMGAISTIRMALARDAILGAFSLTDNPTGDRLSVCRLVQWLNDPSRAQLMTSTEWLTELGYQDRMIPGALARNKSRIDRLMATVPERWPMQENSPANRELAELRTVLKPTRDHLAHALASEREFSPRVDEIRRFIGLVLELAVDAAIVWTGSGSGADDIRKMARGDAERFWATAFKAPIEAYEQHQRRLEPLPQAT